MTLKIDKKIISWNIKKEDSHIENNIAVVGVSTPIERDDNLSGITFRIKPSNENHSLFITINHQEIEGKLYPIELFLNTKNTEHKMWMDALSFLISAIFRQGNDVGFLIDELNNVYNSSGGYWGKNKETGKGQFYKSIVDEIGDVISLYLKTINNEKQHLLHEKEKVMPLHEEEVKYPDNATVCPDCRERALIKVEGCNQCLACNFSKCN